MHRIVARRRGGGRGHRDRREEHRDEQRPRLADAVRAVGSARCCARVAACGSTTTIDGRRAADATAQLIEYNPDNNGVELTVGSKNFTEQFILGEIYAQGLEAAGYDVKTDLNLGSEQVALKALEDGEISGYPGVHLDGADLVLRAPPEDVPNDAAGGGRRRPGPSSRSSAWSRSTPTPFNSANAVGTADRRRPRSWASTTVSDLEGKSQDLTLCGSPECRQRVDCLVGLQEDYGLEFKEFTPVDIGLRYQVLDKGEADLSILFTTDAQLFIDADEYAILEDDQGVFPAGQHPCSSPARRLSTRPARTSGDDREGAGGPVARGHAGAERPC